MSKTRKAIKEVLEPVKDKRETVAIQQEYYQAVARLGEIQMLFKDLNMESQGIVAKIEQLREEFKTK